MLALEYIMIFLRVNFSEPCQILVNYGKLAVFMRNTGVTSVNLPPCNRRRTESLWVELRQFVLS